MSSGARSRRALVLALTLVLFPRALVRVAIAEVGSPYVDRREIVVPAPGAERVRIENPLGRIEIRPWHRAGEIHIVAEKRAQTPEALRRLRVHYTAWKSGEVHVETRVDLGGREQSLPLSGSRIDMVVEVPPDLQIEAKTFAGDLSASGLRAGARLETTGGRIGVSDLRGGVVTRQLRGGQSLTAVDGDIDLDGVEGSMDLRGLGGGRLDARLVDGSIRAEDVRSEWVRLTTTTGEIVFVGLLRPRAHYELRTYAGNVRMIPAGGASGTSGTSGTVTSGFELRSRSPFPVQAGLPLRTVWRQGDRARAIHVSRGGVGHLQRSENALVEISSVLGRVIIQPREVALPERAAER